MKSQNRVGSPLLFLLELVFSILFFSLASAVCVGMFAQAHTLSREARERTLAVNTASSAAELVAAAEDLEELEELLERVFGPLEGEAAPEGLAVTVPLDENFQAAAGGEYALTVEAAFRGRMLEAAVAVTGRAGETVYRLDVAHYIQRGA